MSSLLPSTSPPAGRRGLPALSHDDVRTFHEQGFLVVPALMAPDDVAAIRAALEARFRPATNS